MDVRIVVWLKKMSPKGRPNLRIVVNVETAVRRRMTLSWTCCVYVCMFVIEKTLSVRLMFYDVVVGVPL